MRLDIALFKLKKLSKEELDDPNYYDYLEFIGSNGEKELLGFPKWTYKFITKYTQNWFDWDKLKEEKGINIDKYNFDYTCFSDDDNCTTIVALESKETGESIELNIEDIPTYPVKVPVIGYDKIGYQKEGLNNKFYEDYNNRKIGYYIWSKKELEKYKEEYCIEAYKEHFQKFIIDPFIDGECCVTFW